MVRVLFASLFFQVVLLVLPSPSAAQCSRRISLSDSTFIRCNGVTYSECVVELEVNSAGFWVNGELVIPIVPFVDKLGDSSKAFFRSTKVYRLEVEKGATDRDALIVATQAELTALERVREMTSDIKNSTDLDRAAPSILADPLISDFVTDLVCGAKASA